MIDRIGALIVDESKWLTVSLGLALLASTALYVLSREPMLPARRRIMAALNLFFGVTIGVMALGHLLAVTTKLMQGALEGSWLAFYAIGLAMAVPSWWLIYHTRHVVAGTAATRRTVVLNGWLALTLLALGPQNLPLAAPGLLNVVYERHTRPAVGWAVIGVTAVLVVALFIGSLMFFASGQTFEQLRGLE